MRIVMYGNSLGMVGAVTEIPFMLGNKIERVYKDAKDLQDLECDIAIANYTQAPSNPEDPNDVGWNYLKLPKAKVQLSLQAEHFEEYLPEWSIGLTKNFDGSICFPFNRPFWDFDETIYDIFARSYWEKNNIPIKPRFYFDPLVKWNNFYRGPLNSFEDYGYTLGSETVHRDRIINSSNQFRYMFGDMRTMRHQEEQQKSGIGFNIHKFDIRGKHPETVPPETKSVSKTEAIRLAYWYNLGMAIVTEELDKTFPERLRPCITEVSEMGDYKIDKEQLYKQVINTQKIFESYHDLDYEQDILFSSIIKEYGL